jgi:hypothetical protein
MGKGKACQFKRLAMQAIAARNISSQKVDGRSSLPERGNWPHKTAKTADDSERKSSSRTVEYDGPKNSQGLASNQTATEYTSQRQTSGYQWVDPIKHSTHLGNDWGRTRMKDCHTQNERSPRTSKREWTAARRDTGVQPAFLYTGNGRTGSLP